MRIGWFDVVYKVFFCVLYELDEGFGTVLVVYAQTVSFGYSNVFKACSYGLIVEID